MEVRRRPSGPPRCDHAPPPSMLARCFAQIGGFGLVCVATYVFMIGSMVAATLLWGV